MAINIPKNIIVHHSAVSRSKNPAQFDAIDRYHKSKGWGGIGYHYLIEADGTVRTGRRENKSGAHTSQKLMNYLSIGICLTGHFDQEEPTKAQAKSLLQLIEEIQLRHGISDKNIYPHRHFAKYKSCWGSKLPNDIIGYLKLVTKEAQTIPSWAKDSVEKAKKKGIEKFDKLNDPIDPVQLAWYLKKLGLLSNVEDGGATLAQVTVAFDRAGLLD